VPSTIQQSQYLRNWNADALHVPSLDGLRAISILLVLLGHFLLPSNVSGVAGLGVTTFFFISGFLITRLMFSERQHLGRLDIGNFYFRRLLRLYPVIVASMGVCVAFAIYHGQSFDLIEIQSVFFYFTNYLVSSRELSPVPYTLPIASFWSLSVEEHFYLVFPAIFCLLKGRPRRIAQLAALTCLACLLLRCIYLTLWPEWIGTLATYWRSETRFDAIAFGVLLAALCEAKLGRKLIAVMIKPPIVITAATVLLLSFAYRNAFYQGTIRFTIQSAALFPLIACVVLSDTFSFANRILNLPLMIWIGKLSYSLYVWHIPVIFLLVGLVSTYVPQALQGFALFALSFVVAALSYYLVETPMMRLRKRYRPTQENIEKEIIVRPGPA
jgi:peptidoglycan/LPS O-acetylase OafA/YrhL